MRLRAYDPDLQVGWSVPRARRDYTSSMLMTLPALAVLSRDAAHAPAPGARRRCATGLCDAVMAHWRLVTPALVESIERPAATSTSGRSTTRRASAS